MGAANVRIAAAGVLRMRKVAYRPLFLVLAVALCATARGGLPPYAPQAEVSGFRGALRSDGQVVLQWRTTVELGVEAFRVLRLPDGGGTPVVVGSGCVPAAGDEAGHAYTLTDLPAAIGARRSYVLQSLSRFGPATQIAAWEGKLQAVATPVAMAASDQPVPLAVVPARQHWIGIGARVRAWTNALPADRVRLSLRDEGVYRVSAGELAAASGWSLADITSALASSGLALSCQGAPVAWTAEGTNLFFYGVPPKSRFAPENVYWVQFGAGLSPAPATAVADPATTTNAWFTNCVTQQGTDYLARVSYSALADAPASYVAFSPLLVANGGALQVGQPLTDCATGTWTGSVTVNLLSYYESGTDEHAARVRVGGIEVGTAVWTNEQYLSFTFPFASSNVSAGVATLQVENCGASFVTYSRFICVSCAFTYPRAYRARSEALRCTGGPEGVVAVAGFATEDILALDVTDANQPSLAGPLDLAWSAASNYWTASFPCGGTDRVYAVCSKSAGVLQPSVRGVRDVDWLAPANAADYIILVPPEGWRDDIRRVVQPLADFRNAQGLLTRIVDVESVYNCFSHGIVDPQAIRALCGAGTTNWPGRPLRYLLLAGAGCLDFRHERLSVGDYTACLIPTIIAGQSFADIGEGMTVALDQALGDVTGDPAPEVAIGRLPTASTQEMAVVVEKTIAYEGSLLWKKQASVAPDWDNVDDKYYPFSAATDRIIPSLTAAGRNVVQHYPDPSDPANLALVRVNSLFPALVSGSGIFHFFGHTNEQNLGGGYGKLLRNADISSANWTNPVIAVVIGCRVNRWQSLTTTVCIVPCGVLAKNTGFVAGLGATGYFLASEGESLGAALYAQAVTNGTLRLGDALRDALRQLAPSAPPERLLCFTLDGDPALVFRHDVSAKGSSVEWLALHGMPAPNADLADPDGDGWPTWQEAAAGTDPASFALRVASVCQPPEGDRFAISFQSRSNETYRILFKPSLLAGDWQTVPWSWTNALEWSQQAIPAAGPVTTVLVPVTNAVQGFYRISGPSN
jgi:hypothetical protein